MIPRPSTNWSFEQLKEENPYVVSLQFAIKVDDEIEQLMKGNPYFGVDSSRGRNGDTVLLFINRNYNPDDIIEWLENELTALFARRQPPDELNDADRT